MSFLAGASASGTKFIQYSAQLFFSESRRSNGSYGVNIAHGFNRGMDVTDELL